MEVLHLDQLFLLFSEVFQLLTFQNIILFTLCSAVGILIGALPGLTATMGIALLTGLTYGINLETAIIMLLSVYVGAVSGGSISAILIGIPGTGSAAATVLDGNPLAKKGFARVALSLAMISSTIGTIVGIVFLAIFTPLLQNVALNFTSAEFTLLAIFGITICGSLTSAGEPIKGWIGGFIGMLITSIGFDGIYSFPRFTFGIVGLLGGIALVPAMIGLFGVPNLFHQLAIGEDNVTVEKLGKDHGIRIFPIIKKNISLIIRSGLIGSFIGAIPGVGEDVAAWLAYDIGKKTSKTPEEFGKGSYEGVIAAETGNNACIGGAIIPLLSLAVPGSAPAAVLLGALTLHGIRPGPMLPIQFPNFIIEVSAVLIVATVFMRIVGYFICQGAPHILKLPSFILMPVVGALSVIGSYALYANLFDLYVMFFIGLLGYAFDRLKFPAAPIVLGMILGPLADNSLRRTLMASQGSLAPFYTRPITIILLIMIVFSMVTQFPFYRRLMSKIFCKLKRAKSVS